MPSFSDQEIAEGEAVAALGRRLTGRTCGTCSMCCKVLMIEEEELSKPRDQWCQHCRPGAGGCTIYETRPVLCRAFACQWLVDPSFPEELKPSRSKVVAHFKEDISGHHTLHFVADSAVPGCWREKRMYDLIKSAALQGLRGIPGVAPEGPAELRYRTIVDAGEREWIILPNEDVEITGSYSTATIPTGRESWGSPSLYQHRAGGRLRGVCGRGA